MKTEEGNKLIAEFMGWKSYEDGVTFKFPNLYPMYNINDPENTGWISEQISEARFHTSWDWLMPVVEKINRLGCMVTINLWTETTPPSTEVKIYDWGGMNTIEAELSTPIKAVYDAVTQFIQWYNQKLNISE